MIPERAEYFVWRFMIDQHHQGVGYGRAAMELIIEHVRTLPDARELYISHLRGNAGAAGLYTSMGFTYTGDEDETGDLLMKLQLTPADPEPAD